MEATVTKKDLTIIGYAFDPFHLGIILRELSEIFEPDKDYTCRDLLEIAGEIIYAECKAVYISQKEYDGYTQAYKEKRNMPKVGDKYELLPYRQFKYEKYITPLFYSALICKGIRKYSIIREVTEKIFADFGTLFNPLSKRLIYTCKSEIDKSRSEKLYNYYLRVRVDRGVE